MDGRPVAVAAVGARTAVAGWIEADLDRQPRRRTGEIGGGLRGDAEVVEGDPGDRASRQHQRVGEDDGVVDDDAGGHEDEPAPRQLVPPARQQRQAGRRRRRRSRCRAPRPARRAPGRRAPGPSPWPATSRHRRGDSRSAGAARSGTRRRTPTPGCRRGRTRRSPRGRWRRAREPAGRCPSPASARSTMARRGDDERRRGSPPGRR